jgi:hypothetical protein
MLSSTAEDGAPSKNAAAAVNKMMDVLRAKFLSAGRDDAPEA